LRRRWVAIDGAQCAGDEFYGGLVYPVYQSRGDAGTGGAGGTGEHGVFSILLVIIGGCTAYAVLVLPNLRIIPIVLGIFGYTYGSLLGVSSRDADETRGNNGAM